MAGVQHLLLIFFTKRDIQKKGIILMITRRTESKLREFEYKLSYQNIAHDLINEIKFPFITLFKQTHLNVLTRLNEGENRSNNDGVIVIHDHRDISDSVVPHLAGWK